MLWQKVPSLKHVWKWSQFWLIDNYMAVSLLKAVSSTGNTTTVSTIMLCFSLKILI